MTKPIHIRYAQPQNLATATPYETGVPVVLWSDHCAVVNELRFEIAALEAKRDQAFRYMRNAQARTIEVIARTESMKASVGRWDGPLKVL